MNEIITLINDVGFPIAMTLGLGFFVWKLLNKIIIGMEQKIDVVDDKINESLNHHDFEKSFYLHCAGGYRSMIALSILKNRGIHGGVNVAGGMKAIKETSIDLQEMSCSN